MPAKRVRFLIGLALLCFCGLYELDRTEPYFYAELCNQYKDAVARAGRLTPPNPNLVFLAIDSESVSLDPKTDGLEMYGLTENGSIEARAFSLMGQQFPWPREIYGLILERLVLAGAKAVMLDVTFPTETAGDPPFRLALERFRDHVVIGSNFVDPSWNGLERVGASNTRPPDSLIPVTVPMDKRIGYTNFWPDADNTVRRAQYRVTFEQVQRENPKSDTERFLSLGARAMERGGLSQSIPPGLEPRIIRFTGPPRQTFPPHSVFEIFVPDYWKHNYRGGDYFRDKIVIVGAEGNWQHDAHETPFGSMPGPELHLNAINAALHHDFIHELPPAWVPLLTAFAALVAVILSSFVRSPWLRLLCLGLANLVTGWGVLQAYDHASVYLPIICPLTQLNLTVLLGLVTDFTQERLEKKRVRRTLERYVSRDLVREMLDQPASYRQSLGGVLKPVTILFSDIRGYSTVSARSEPHLLVSQLNEYLTAMVDCVFRFGGTLDKFIGDAVMAVWGNVHSHGSQTDAIQAVRAARAMRDELVKLNESWKKRGWPELRAGIAVHHGEVVVGNIGSPQRMEFTVIGDAVNVTWKLQEMTKEIGCPFIMSEQVRVLVDSEFDLQPVGLVRLPSLQDPIRVFTFSELAVAPTAAESSPVPVLAEMGFSFESPATR